MKNLYVHLFCILFLATVFSAVHLANAAEKVPGNQLVQLQATTATAAPITKAKVMGAVEMEYEKSEPGGLLDPNFYFENWGILSLSLLAFFEVIVRLTPSLKDNSIVNFLTMIVNAIIPNFRKGGGVF